MKRNDLEHNGKSGQKSKGRNDKPLAKISFRVKLSKKLFPLLLIFHCLC